MTWFDKLLGRTPVPEEDDDFLKESFSEKSINFNPGSLYVPPTILTKMKWVVYQGHVGIITDLSGAGFIWIDLVQEDGTTYSSVRAPANEVEIAKIVDIPWSRKKCSARALNDLGYY